MDLFILDSQLRRSECLDQYESLIWAERLAAAGDFELNITSNRNTRTLLVPGTRLAINESKRMMTVETVVDKVDDEGRAQLQVKGPSFESILDERVVQDVVTVPQPQNPWIFTDMAPADIIREIFEKIVVDPTISPGDTIPFYTPGNLYPADTIDEPSVITGQVGVSIDTLYNTIKKICDIYDLGFRLVRNGDESEIMFNIYSGNDRTGSQLDFPPVIFSPKLENLQDTAYLTSNNGFKNVAYVVSPDGSAFAYSYGSDENTSGLDRRVLLVDAGDILIPPRDPAPYEVTEDQIAAMNVAVNLTTTTQPQKEAMQNMAQIKRLSAQNVIDLIALTAGTSTLTTDQKADIDEARTTNVAYNATEDPLLQTRLIQRGVEELANRGPLFAFDGEIPKNSQYVYDVDYFLGDLVELRTTDEVGSQMRVTEHIYISDATGVRSYPTLATQQVITPGSWLAEPSAEVWADLVDEDDTWESRP